MSPSSMTRSLISWCGLAPLGPEPTTVKSTCEWPCARRKPARSAAISLSVRPAKRTPAMSSKLASAAAPAVGEPLDLVLVLDRAQHRQRAGHRDVARAGQRRLQPEHVHRPRRVGDRVAPVRVEQRGRRRVGVVAVRPVGQRHHAGGGRVLGVRALEDRHDHRRLSRAVDDEHRDALGDRDRRVAGEVEEVGTRGHEQPREPRFPCLLRAAAQPPREVLGGERCRGHRSASA